MKSSIQQNPFTELEKIKTATDEVIASKPQQTKKLLDAEVQKAQKSSGELGDAQRLHVTRGICPAASGH